MKTLKSMSVLSARIVTHTRTGVDAPDHPVCPSITLQPKGEHASQMVFAFSAR